MLLHVLSLTLSTLKSARQHLYRSFKDVSVVVVICYCMSVCSTVMVRFKRGVKNESKEGEVYTVNHILKEHFRSEHSVKKQSRGEEEKRSFAKTATFFVSSSTMYLDSNLKIEVLSSIFGEALQLYDHTRGKTVDLLSVGDFFFSTIFGKRQDYVKEFFIDEANFFDPQYDYDFTNLSDSTECRRGDEVYKRPNGWYRMALKVRGKYPDGDTWLGPNGWRSYSVPGEWPVSYHGTSLNGAKGIIRSHYKAGSGSAYGRGIYSTPDIQVAERENYAKTFTSKTTGKSYKVVLQNRIHPTKREICQRSDYWLIRVNEGTSEMAEKAIVESSIRPYGVLIKEV